MKAKFIGDARNPGEPNNLPETMTAYGVTFERGKWADVPAEHEAKFVGNRHFETRGAPETEEGKEAAEAAKS